MGLPGEPQGQRQASFLVRVVQYLLMLYQELRHGPHEQDRYQMTAAIVNVTEQPLQSILTWVPPGATGGVGLTAKVWVHNVYQEKASETLAAIAAGTVARCLLPWVPLMEGGEQEEAIAEWKRLAGQEPDRVLRSNYGGLALVFAEKRQRGEVWRRGLEGWNVEESAIVKEWQQRALERGLEQGLERGLSALRSSLLGVLGARFPEPLPEPVRSAIAQQNDFDGLSRWLVLASTALSLDAFRAGILPGNGAATG